MPCPFCEAVRGSHTCSVQMKARLFFEIKFELPERNPPNSAHKVVGAWPRRVTDETARLQNIGGRRILGYRHLKGDARRKQRPNYVGFQKDLILLISHRSGEASSRKSDPVNEGGRNNEPRIRGTIKIIPQPVKMHKSEDECKTPPPKRVGWYSTSRNTARKIEPDCARESRAVLRARRTERESRTCSGWKNPGACGKKARLDRIRKQTFVAATEEDPCQSRLLADFNKRDLYQYPGMTRRTKKGAGLHSETLAANPDDGCTSRRAQMDHDHTRHLKTAFDPPIEQQIKPLVENEHKIDGNECALVAPQSQETQESRRQRLKAVKEKTKNSCHQHCTAG
ncbi:hypothetical protein K438DRAFT_1935135 [Mycena galopus ATCC 62051]|nr:hypothetical protein K438DRAFT_1935135 [Mycena galopus ATCC 62051]